MHCNFVMGCSQMRLSSFVPAIPNRLRSRDYGSEHPACKIFFDRFYSLFSRNAGTLQPTYLEAILVANWASGPAAIPKDKRRRGNRAALQARFWAMLFPNMRAHTYRVSGRAAAANGKIAKAIRFFRRRSRSCDQVWKSCRICTGLNR